MEIAPEVSVDYVGFPEVTVMLYNQLFSFMFTPIDGKKLLNI
jgi:hypothetical protein